MPVLDTLLAPSSATLAAIVTATVASGLVSVGFAGLLAYAVLARLVRWLVSLSAGLLLATSILHLLPEALESGADVHRIAWTLLVGLLAYFALEKAAILRHSHHHEGDGHHHHHGHDREEAGPGGALILIGDTVHNFADGVLVAAAFIADPHLGWLTALAVATHEIPQEIGDFIVLRNAGYTRARALAFNLLSSAAAVAGGVIAWAWLEQAREFLPYVLTVAASGFIYVALADLIPTMQRGARHEAPLQVALLAAGIGVGALLAAGLHAH